MSLFNKKYPSLSYQIDFKQLIYDMLPVKFRKLKIFTYLSVIFNSLETHYNKILKDRLEFLELQNVKGETHILEFFLNKHFKTSGITIQNVKNVGNNVYLFKPNETPQEADKVFLYEESELISSDQNTYLYSKTSIEEDVDFIVNVPNTLFETVSVYQLKGVIDRYRFLGTIYTVKGY